MNGKTKKGLSLVDQVTLTALSWTIPKAVPRGIAHPSPVARSIAIAALQDSEGTLYLEHLLNCVKGEINVKSLERAFQSMIDRHDSLRTRYFLDDTGEIMAEIIESGKCQGTVDVVDRRTQVDGFESADDTVASLKKRPMDISEAPLIRLSLVMLPDNMNMILLTASHAAVDGTSGPTFLKEFSSLYNGNKLAPVKYQYSQFGAWQKKYLSMASRKSRNMVENQLAFWEKTLAGVPPLLDMALDYPRPKVFRGHAETVTIEVDPALYDKVRSFMEVHHQSPWRIFLIAYYFALRAYSGQEDMVINIPRTTRLPIMLDTIGHFANFVPIRVGVGDMNIDSCNMIEASRRLGLAMKEAVRNGDVMFDDIVDRVCSQRDLSYMPVSQAALSILLEEWIYFPEFQGTDRLPLPLDVNDNHRIMTDLYLRVFLLDDSLALSMSYNRDIFQENSVHNLLGFIEKTLAFCMENEDTRVCDTPMYANLGSKLHWEKSLAGMPAESALLASFRAEKIERKDLQRIRSITVGEFEWLHGTGSDLPPILLAGTGLCLLQCTGAGKIAIATKSQSPTSPYRTMDECFQFVLCQIDDTRPAMVEEMLLHVSNQVQQGRQHGIFSWKQMCHMAGILEPNHALLEDISIHVRCYYNVMIHINTG